MTDPAAHPKIQELKAKADKEIKPHEDGIAVLDKPIKAIETALSGCAP